MATGGKAVRFEVSGITAGRTRVMTVPDEDGTIALSSNVVLGMGIIDGGKPDSFYGGAKLNFGGVT